ncbi:acyl-CoA thioesterase [Prauserella muralis]|uniref:Thioesterase n=1 Tax=Prauserella muralis TaxID=588067 RepID=A0A2V4B2X1_9PSEU|nr:thioesterase family protein [Prauserella muralis]PXY28377.1 thioesterase [Prauserella muralis]
MDAFGHVNHANMVTLLEEARVPLLFGEAPGDGLAEFAKGIVVVRLSVDYRSPVVVDGRDVRVEITLSELRHASFTLSYTVHNGPSGSDPVAVTARTTLAPYDVGGSRPRRLTATEREFLRTRIPGGPPA